MEPSPSIEQSKKPFYKYCIVPMCKNTIRTAPDKVFFFVPRGEDIRRKWCKIMKRDMVSPSSYIHCCEDHFDMEEDTDNYMMYKIMNLQEKQNTSLRLKKGILPHKFQCQKVTKSQPPQMKKRKRLIESTVSAPPAKQSVSVNDSSTENYLEADVSMEILKKCRICLVENVRMYVVANKNLQEIYEKLTDVPFVTEDRPMLACFLCCSKLKQCYQFQRKCLEAEKLFVQMLNEDNEAKTLYQGPLEFYSEFNITPTEHISIVDVCQTESFAIKEELPEDIIVPTEEHQFDEQELDIFNNSCLDVADIPPHCSESDFIYDVPLMEFKTEVEEEQEVSKNKRRASDTTSVTVAKKPKLEDAVTAEQTIKEESDSKVIQLSQICTSKPGTSFKEPVNSSLNPVNIMIQHSRTQIGEIYKCYVCSSSFSEKRYLTKHKLTQHR